MTYGRNVETYNNEKAIIIGDREEADGDWTVKTKIVRRMPRTSSSTTGCASRTATWQVIDVIIEGVSLVANFRSQFQDILSSDGPDKLIELLREKNAKGESLKS